MFSNVSTPLSMHAVRRLAPASIAVCERHAGNAAVATHVSKLVPVANGVLVALQQLDQLKIDLVKQAAESNEQIAALNGVMLEWTGPLARDIEGFDLGAFTRNAKLTFDVLQKAISLKQTVETKGVELPYRETLLTELTARIDGASGADRSAQAARVALQEKQREVRELSARFHKELVSFRPTLRGALGSSHIDYRRLRVASRVVAEEPPGDGAPVTEPSASETTRPAAVA